MNRKKLREAAVGYSFVAPALVLLIVFCIAPIFISIVLSFMKFNGFDTPSWIGVKNYISMFKDKDFYASLKNTVYYVIVTVTLQTFLALLLAAILAEKFRNPFGELVRGIAFVPVLCSATIAGTIFSYIFSSESESVMNLFVGMFGLDKINWMGRTDLALPVVCLATIWKNVGYFMVILYAAIMEVPASLHEAAKCDGATSSQRFFYITIPSIKPVLYLVLTLGSIWAFQAFDMIYVMTRGGPGNATLTPVLIVYEQAFTIRKMGYASAIAVILAIMIFIITVVQRKLFNEKAGE